MTMIERLEALESKADILFDVLKDHSNSIKAITEILAGMRGNKPWFLSKTVIAGAGTMVIAVIPIFAPQFGLTKDQILNLVSAVATVTGATTIYGRITAKDKIGGKSNEG